MSKKHEEKVEIVPQGIPEVAPQFDQALLPPAEPVAPRDEIEMSMQSFDKGPDDGVELTDEETQSAIRAAIADKVKEIEERQKAEAADSRSQRQRHARQSNPKGWAGLDPSGTGTYEYVEFLVNGNRRLLVGGNNFEHVDTDADGVWLFRAMD